MHPRCSSDLLGPPFAVQRGSYMSSIFFGEVNLDAGATPASACSLVLLSSCFLLVRTWATVDRAF